jgi:hypothetical protein
MTTILPALAVAFGAFVVWLAVRIANRRERWAKWTLAVVIGLSVLYVASFGPACWAFRSNMTPGSLMFVEKCYRPLVIASRDSPPPIAIPLRWWASLYAPPVSMTWDGSAMGGYQRKLFSVTDLLDF